MNKTLFALILFSGMALSNLSRAEEMASGDHAGTGLYTAGAKHTLGDGDHVFGRDWKETLSDEQKSEIDWLTLRLLQKQQLLRAQMKVKEEEISQLVVGEDTVPDQWHAKVDELLQLKKDYLLNTYQHKVEIRQILTPQQRVSYDLGIVGP